VLSVFQPSSVEEEHLNGCPDEDPTSNDKNLVKKIGIESEL